MAKGKDPVKDHIQAGKRMVDFFGCEGDFFFKPLLDSEWMIRHVEDFYFLCYRLKDGKKVEAVVVKKGGEPLIYKKNDYTMVVAIDCVRIGFIFCNTKNTEQTD